MQAPCRGPRKRCLADYGKLFRDYGERARQAERNEGVGWKALSHAVRVGIQAIELLATGHVTFPRPEAADLLAIKSGALPYAAVAVAVAEAGRGWVLRNATP